MSGCCCFECISEMEGGIVENCGKLDYVAPPGLVILQWPIQSIRARVSLKIKQLQVSCETKTKDNVFVTVVVAVQYKVDPEKVSSAFYKLTDPVNQIRSYVFDVLRSTVPRMDLDSAFASKDDIANSVKSQLENLMGEYGYIIIASLCTDIEPNQHNKRAMNEINASQRLRVAASFKADADKILQVKAAEAEAESKYLSGMGVAKQRKAIVDGLRDSVNEFSSDVPGTGPKDVMDLLLITQYFDMLKEVGHKGGSIFLPHGPSSIQNFRNELSDSFVTKGR